MALLAVDLKEGTKTVHAEAERSKFVKYFFRGEITPATYGRFLISLYQVYSALEDALDKHKDNANILAKKLQKYNDLPEGKGVAFYSFDTIENKTEFKDMYRIRLNQVEVDEETHKQIVEESCQAFVRNIDVFAEFDHELEGLPLTKKEQEALEAAQAANKASTSGILSNLANSLASAVGYKANASA
ncbi:Heme oxygenase 2 [Mortierella sp. GBA35]|nr:Heme oxygenase 2 [Mortierella sp. GBA35]